MADAPLILFLIACFIAAGAVKGVVGLGLPTASIALMTLILDPRLAITLMLVPLMATNAWQVYRMGQIRQTFYMYFPAIAAITIGVWITVTLSANAPDRLLFAMLGTALMIFVAVNALSWSPLIEDRHDLKAQLGFGAAAGVFGGMTSVWAPPIAIYLASRRVSKEEFVRASGMFFFLGSIPLMAGYLQMGLFNGQTALLSSAMLLPAMLGFYLGERLRGQLSETAFRKVLLFVFFVLGLNLIRRAIF